MNAPSVYELLPFDDYEWRDPPAINLTLDCVPYSFTPAAYSHYTVPIRRANVNYSVVLPSTGEQFLEPFCEDCWRLSQESRARIRNVKLPDGVRFYNAVGIKQATPKDIIFGEVKAWTDLQSKEIKFVNGDGDGTVSYESAKQHGLDPW